MMLKNFFTVKVVFVTTVFLSVLLVGLVVLYFVGVPLIIDNQIEKNVRLDMDTIQWDRFLELPLAFDVKVFLFEVTNPDRVVNHKEIPIVKEIGPYHYTEKRNKHIEGFNDDEDSVTFNQTMTLEFNQEASGNLTDHDEITIINPLLINSS
ncbi:unnamed protein product [Acanthoscelides obtectus]|uniref:Sensory neuron membrane protein 2 n=1 Tax=Acanthoscelides obtectus TaxID=200917 RepID=A0A9P0K9S4_ACAOB|nr:unnamed protein product [Acanthoscelides obtectus]